MTGPSSGVAAPINVAFGVEPEDRAAIQKLVTITTVPAVEGAWGWVPQDDGRWAMVYRTRDYWPAGTTVHVDAKLYGVKFNDTSYGASDITSDFTIGRNQVVIADVNSHELVVQQNGATVASYPASYGRGEDTGDPNLITRSGIHVVNEFFETKLMSNPRYGYSNEPGTLGRPDQQQRRVHPRQPGQQRRPGQLQRHPRLRQPVAGRCGCLLPLGDLG